MSSTEMKSYLSLIPISAKVRRRQNRMTILCIVLAVFLVTAVFSMADMAIRMETSNQLNKNGNWHIMVKDISPETAAELAAQEDVAAFSAYSDINASLTENYFAGDKRAALVGADDAILQIFPGMQCSTYFDNLPAWICSFLNETSRRPTTVFHSPSCGNKWH